MSQPETPQVESTGHRGFLRGHWKPLAIATALLIFVTLAKGWLYGVLLFGFLALIAAFLRDAGHTVGRIQRRRTAIERLADRREWSFERQSSGVSPQMFAPFSFMLRGSRHHLENCITGSIRLERATIQFTAADFVGVDVIQSSRGAQIPQVQQYSFILCNLPWPTQHQLVIRFQSVSDDLLQAGASFGDIDFESAEFNRVYVVKCPDKRFAYAMIHPRAMQRLLDVKPSFVAIDQRRLCLTDRSRCWSAEEFERYLTWLADFLAEWPEHEKRKLDVTSPERHGGTKRA